MEQDSKASHRSLVHDLACRLAGDEPSTWLGELRDLLSGQDDETLTLLLSQTEGLDELELQALDATLSYYLYEYDSDDNSDLVKEPIAADEFYLRVAFSLVPLSVAYHRPMLGQVTHFHDGEVELNAEDLYISVSSDVQWQVSNMLPEARSLKLARGFYMHEQFSGDNGLPSEPDLEWLSEHALEIFPHIDAAYRHGFNRGLAEELLRVQTPVMRVGVL